MQLHDANPLSIAPHWKRARGQPIRADRSARLVITLRSPSPGCRRARGRRPGRDLDSARLLARRRVRAATWCLPGRIRSKMKRPSRSLDVQRPASGIATHASATRLAVARRAACRRSAAARGPSPRRAVASAMRTVWVRTSGPRVNDRAGLDRRRARRSRATPCSGRRPRSRSRPSPPSGGRSSSRSGAAAAVGEPAAEHVGGRLRCEKSTASTCESSRCSSSTAFVQAVIA